MKETAGETPALLPRPLRFRGPARIVPPSEGTSLMEEGRAMARARGARIPGLSLGVALFLVALAIHPDLSHPARHENPVATEIVRQLSDKVPWTGRRRVGVSPFRDLPTDRVDLWGKELAKALTSALTGSRQFQVITLDVERLAEVLRRELSDLKDPRTRARLGRLFGIEVLLAGTHKAGWLDRTVYAELTELERGTTWGVTVHVQGRFAEQAWFWVVSALLLVGAVLAAAEGRRRLKRAREIERQREESLRKREAEALYAEAMGHYAEGRLVEARVKAEEALSRNPNHFEASVLVEKIGKGLAAQPVGPRQEEPIPPPSATPEPPPTFHIRVWTDSADAPLKRDRLRTRDIKTLPSREESRYKLGDRITIYFASERDCYLRLVNIGPTGNMRQLFPNRYHPENSIRAGIIHSLPGPGYGEFEFKLGPPAGLETVKAVASAEPFDLAGIEKEGAFARLMTRDIQVLPAHGANPGAARAEDFCRFFVAEQG